MARYIDADKLVDWCKETLQVQSTLAGKAYVDAFLTAVLSCPTADVAPRAEVAREIFEEIEEARKRWESIWKSDHYGSGGGAYGYLETDVDSTIYDLKKKYTEGQK
jgi:hypothetical protein